MRGFVFLLALVPAFAAAQDSYRFIVLGDRTGAAQPGVFGKIVDQAVRSVPAPAFFINVGDLIQGDAPDTMDLIRQWEEVKTQLAPITGRFEFHPVPGNHDMTSQDAVPFYERYMGKQQYSFEKGPDRFIVLDNSGWSEKGAVSKARLEWLEKALSKPGRKRHVFVFYHKPLWHLSPGEARMGPLHALFRKYGVDYVINGHDHEYRYAVRDKVTYIKVGSSGSNSKRRRADGTLFHYILADVGSEKVTLRPVALGGDTLPVDWVDEKKAAEIEEFARAFGFDPVSAQDTALAGTLVFRIRNPIKTAFPVTLDWNLPKDAAWSTTPASSLNLTVSRDTSLEFRFTASAHMPLPRLLARYPFGGDTLTESFTPFIRRQMAFPKTGTPVTIDAEPGEPVWANRPSNWFANGTHWSDSSWAALAYDQTNLYVAFKAFDPNPDSIITITPSTARDTFAENDDLFRFYFGQEGDTGRFAMVYVMPTGAFKDVLYRLKDDYFISEVFWNGVSACSAKKTAWGWQGELSVPWKNTPWKKPVDLRINFKRENNRLARKGHRAWQMPYDMPPRFFGLAGIKNLQ